MDQDWQDAAVEAVFLLKETINSWFPEYHLHIKALRQHVLFHLSFFPPQIIIYQLRELKN